MRCGIIDVGSNTIRLSIYEYDEQNMNVLMHKKTMAGILNHIHDKLLQPEGVVKLCRILGTYQTILDNLEITQRHCFATASLRGIDNQLDVIVKVKAETGLDIQIIPGDEEAKLDFIGATRNIPANEGIIVDIGGGSTELILYRDKKIMEMVSLPFGSLSMYIHHVKRLLPKDKEREAIAQEVAEALERLPESFRNTDIDCSILCGIGGAIRGANALYRSLLSDKTTAFRMMTGGDIDNMLLEFSKEKKEVLLKILKVKPDRIHTVIPGMVILKCIMERFGCQTICVSKFGVREGYVQEYVMKNAV